MSKDWNTSTQFYLTVEKSTKVTILGYSETRTDNCEKLVSFCVVKGNNHHRVPSYQFEGIGFGSHKPFEYTFEPDTVYTIVTYCTDETVQGNFGLCFFSKKGSKLTIEEAQEWKYSVHCSGQWLDNTAAGAGENRLNNLKFHLTNKEKKPAKVLVMLRQINKSFDALVFADGGHKITGTKFHVGYYVLSLDLKDITKTDQWVNSYDVYKFLDLDAGQSVIILPTTVNEGEEMAYEVHAYSDSKIILKSSE